MNTDPNDKLRARIMKMDCEKHEDKNIYNMNGLLLESKKDLCDCNVITCPGCFYPCENCSATKCGHQCRVNREWRYEKWTPYQEVKK
ncbi:ARL14 effector protein-like [Daktulosphaira vitifoliae]|uniref:ARL14 effector protein-like n=1 Tax=Daktulosphaira vitifoliae TaxID=58002 RepID=UPI0021AAD278|nr:ARL14 effector protein-like [Daktulosphaira vitifoliae]